jgi:hypothetical protein
MAGLSTGFALALQFDAPRQALDHLTHESQRPSGQRLNAYKNR